jgi:hypothetical protein
VIRDPIVLPEIRRDWAGVEALRSTLNRSAAGSIIGFGGIFPFALANAAHNLPFIHAFAVLNDVLEQLADEGHFHCKSFFLGQLLQSSEQVLPWQNFAEMSAGAMRRNDVAHHGLLLERGECWKYIDAIKAELSAWAVLRR